LRAKPKCKNARLQVRKDNIALTAFENNTHGAVTVVIVVIVVVIVVIVVIVVVIVVVLFDVKSTKKKVQ
jgi:heme/copper-type cytochrome/quinol oxidase subunit 2